MRFDEYLQQRGITAVPVDRMDGLSVVADAVAPDAPVGTGAGPSQITFTPGCER